MVRPSFAPVAAALLAVLGALSVARPARADELPFEPDKTASLLVGAGVASVSFGVGFTMAANSGHGLVQNAGIITAQTGLTLAPLLAHGVAGEWKRGAVFALPSLAAEVGMLVLVQHWKSKLVTGSSLPTQYGYSALFTASVIGAAVGVIDSMYAGDRARARAASANRAWILPTFEPGGGGGIAIGGVL